MDRGRGVVFAAERFQCGVVKRLRADRKAIDAGGGLLLEQLGVLGIGLQRDFAIGGEHEGARGGVDQPRDLCAAQQGRGAAAKEQALRRALAEPFGVGGEIGFNGGDQSCVVGAARAIDVEVAIRADGGAIRPVHINAKAAHLSAASNFSNARARCVSGNFSSGDISAKVLT